MFKLHNHSSAAPLRWVRRTACSGVFAVASAVVLAAWGAMPEAAAIESDANSPQLLRSALFSDVAAYESDGAALKVQIDHGVWVPPARDGSDCTGGGESPPQFAPTRDRVQPDPLLT